MALHALRAFLQSRTRDTIYMVSRLAHSGSATPLLNLVALVVGLRNTPRLPLR